VINKFDVATIYTCGMVGGLNLREFIHQGHPLALGVVLMSLWMVKRAFERMKENE